MWIRCKAPRPRWIAWVLLAAGAAYVVDAVAHLVLADYEASADLFVVIVAVPSIVGEMSFAVWLLLVATGRRTPPDAAAEASAEPGASGAQKPRGRRPRREEEPDIVPSDERTMQALEFVTDVIDEMELDCRVRLRRPREGDSPDEINIEIIGRDAGLAIGKKGQVLQALQFLTHRVVNRPGLDKRHVLVDAEGYRSRRDDSLASMAKRLGRQAVHEGKIITFEPMNPRDRRVVHRRAVV